MDNMIPSQACTSFVNRLSPFGQRMDVFEILKCVRSYINNIVYFLITSDNLAYLDNVAICRLLKINFLLKLLIHVELAFEIIKLFSLLSILLS